MPCRSRYWSGPLPGMSTVTADHSTHASSGQKKSVLERITAGALGLAALIVPAVMIL